VKKRESIKRREFIEKVGVGSAALLSLPAVASGQDHAHTSLSGPQANATVSFGQWPADPAVPLDRFPDASPRLRNVHMLLPHEVTIKAGGAVNFIIAGFHHVLVYDDGTQPEDINTALIHTTTGAPGGVALINDPTDRIYRGLDPSRLHLVNPTGGPSLGVQDRVEVVRFPNQGHYLVICGVRGHFTPAPGVFEMFGFVRVLP